MKDKGIHLVYVDAYHDRNRDTIHVVERGAEGNRVHTQYPARHVFYYPDPKGKFTSIYGDTLGRYSTTSSKAFNKEKKSFYGKKLFESDVNTVFRCISDYYLDAPVPKLNVGFFDIEVDFNKDLGFAPPHDPFNMITAVGVHLNWLNKTICLVIKPKGMSQEEAVQIVGEFDDVILMDTEAELLLTFLELIEDTDILSGWNSEGFDIPYITNRIALILGKDYTKKLCLWEQYPTKRKYEMYGKEQETYDLTGRVHLDYMQLYRKYTYHEMHSYALNAISEHELEGEKKVDYEGTLDQLYNNDFKEFIEYNIQDTDLLRKLDDKLQFIDLSNVLAHANGVLLPNTMGAVAQTDQAIVNEAHSRGLIVPDKVRGQEHTQAAGAYVATPVKGMHQDIGSIDLKSLYPSILRACNMSPECIIGQVRHTITGPQIEEIKKKYKEGAIAKFWEGKFACMEYELVMQRDREITLTLDFEDGKSYTASGAEVHDLVFNNGKPWCITSNGTIFTFEKQGVVPGLLARWYAERKELQRPAGIWYKLYEGKAIDDAALAALAGEVSSAEYAADNYITHNGTGWVCTDNAYASLTFGYWDKRQLVKKINLNSLYGALLNPGSRFFDQRLGQSTTLTGRCIARHMSAAANESISGVYDHIGKSIIYGDTDSVYFSAYPVYADQIASGEFKWDKDTIIELYDAVGAAVNDTFPGYMERAHNCPDQYGSIIAANRETVSEKGIFISKKRYGLLVYDDEGTRVDADGKRGKLKVMGLEIKRSDTPGYMQEFLKEILSATLEGADEQTIINRILEFRTEFKAMPAWEKGTPKRVNNLTKYTTEWKKTGKCRVGHVTAAINYNRLREMHKDQYSLEITDGMKTIVCKLKPNPLGMTSIGIPTDEKRIPDWYKELPFDNDLMEETIITKKISNLLGTLPWDLSRAENKTTFNSLFKF
jgi:DNA polymerase elongation subunit (family B)